ncbi:MAG TPA: DMT family transporter [Thermoleophilaceae bacterium]|nr:DMT family transporter [Thermoleophilaceae bacterium]
MLGIGLALLASLAWGFGDFIGGAKSRVLPVLVVIVCSQVVGFVWIAGVAAIAHEPVPGGREAAFAALSALAGTAGLACFFRAIAIGKMSLVVPIASMAGVVPVIVGIATGDRPSVVQLAGMVIALAGAVLASREPDEGARGGSKLAAGVLLAALSAFLWGWFFLALDVASDGGAVWASLINRTTSLALLLVAAAIMRPHLAAARPHMAALALAGTLDVSANLLFAAATTKGLVSLVSVAGSLYPVVTVLLARVVLKERVHRVQELGVAAALGGVVLIAAG